MPHGELHGGIGQVVRPEVFVVDFSGLQHELGCDVREQRLLPGALEEGRQYDQRLSAGRGQAESGERGELEPTCLVEAEKLTLAEGDIADRQGRRLAAARGGDQQDHGRAGSPIHALPSRFMARASSTSVEALAGVVTRETRYRPRVLRALPNWEPIVTPSLLAPVRAPFRALAASIVPEAATLDEAGWQEAEGIVSRALATRPEAMVRQLLLFIRLANWLALLPYGRPFTRLGPAARKAHLTRLENAPLLLIRRGFWGLRTLVFMGYYGQDRVRKELGYRASAAGWGGRSGRDGEAGESGASGGSHR